MDMVLLVCAGVLLLFAFVVAFGAPYLPTFSAQTTDALDLLELKPGETLLELGCGDGRVLLAAARRGIHGVGYELNPILVVIARLMTWRYRSIVTVHWGDYWRADWPQAHGVYVFLLDRYMSKLHTKVIRWQQGPVRVVSYAFAIPDKKPVVERNGLFLYRYPAPKQNKRTI